MRRFFVVLIVVCFNIHSAIAIAAVQTSLHINQVDQKQLILLKGIGKKRAAAIISYRQAHGKFHTTQDLLLVPGISQKLLDNVEKKNDSKVVFD